MDSQLLRRYRQKLLQEVSGTIDWCKRLGMRVKLNKVTVMMILISVSCISTNAQPVLKPNAKSLNEAMAERVVHLFSYWPDATVLSSPKRVSGDESSWIALVKSSSIEWVRKVLNPTWLPEENKYIEDNFIMIRNEFNEVDVTHVQWTKNGYNIKVSQTASIITIKFTPLQSKGMGETVEQKREFAKSLCRQIFTNTGMRYGIKYDVDEKGKHFKKPIKVPVN